MLKLYLCDFIVIGVNSFLFLRLVIVVLLLWIMKFGNWDSCVFLFLLGLNILLLSKLSSEKKLKFLFWWGVFVNSSSELIWWCFFMVWSNWNESVLFICLLVLRWWVLLIMIVFYVLVFRNWFFLVCFFEIFWCSVWIEVIIICVVF